MNRNAQNTGFTCSNCQAEVVPLTNGSFRNHCPFCLHSRHVDVAPGDRRARCGGLMAPAGLRYRAGRWQVVHRCLRCGAVRPNRVAVDTAQPDDLEALARLAGPG